MPTQEVGEIIAVEPDHSYLRFSVRAPGVATGFRPGHFVAVAVGGPNTAMLLRRSFALLDAADGVVRFIVSAKGPGTQWLVRQRVGDSLDVVGPLGTPFSLPPSGAAGSGGAVLVAGGYGTAPLIELGRELLSAGRPIEFVLGAGSADRLCAVDDARALGAPVHITTDDGSAGTHGRVTDVLDDAMTRVGAEVVYACGPMPMLRAIGAAAARQAVLAQVAVEESMACGIGVCMTCVLPVRGADGLSRFVRSCVDGPVFDAADVRFDDIGTLPADLVGADAMSGH